MRAALVSNAWLLLRGMLSGDVVHRHTASSPAALDRRTGHWRPQEHFSPPANWLNDPNGLFRDDEGVWHLYYQYGYSPYPELAKAWGHATSTDLYSWVDHDIAIRDTPSEGSIWSGSIVVDKNNTSSLSGRDGADSADSARAAVLAYFTSWKEPEEAQYLAFSLDGGYSFTPYIGNPLISLGRHGFRDPKVIFHPPSARWVMALTLEDRVVFYASRDLRSWSRLSDFVPDPPLGYIECPQLVRVARRRAPAAAAAAAAAAATTPSRDSPVADYAYLLVLSLANGGPGGQRSAVKYIVGSFDGVRFIPDAGARGTAHDIDFGPDVYATAFFHMPFPASALPDRNAYSPVESNVVSISWASSLAYAGDTPTAASEGWRHCMTAAREHFVDARTNRLISVPAPLPRTLIESESESESESSGAGARRLLAAAGTSEGGRGIRLVFDEALRARNPALEWEWSVSVPPLGAPAAGGTETCPRREAVELAFSSSTTGEQVGVRLDIELAATAADSARPSATLTLRRTGMRGWHFPASLESFASPTMETSPAADGGHEIRVSGLLDRSIVEAYAAGGATAGTMLFFADGVLDTVSVGRVADGDDGGPGGVRFGFEARELRSAWGDGGAAQEDEMGEL